MEKQSIAICKLSAAESAIVNARKRNKEKFWTHKVVCGEHVTFLTVGRREDLAKWVIDLWPLAFSGISSEVHPNAKSVEQADRRYLITLEEKFGNPDERKREEMKQRLIELEREHGYANGSLSGLISNKAEEKPKKGFLSRLFGK